MDYQALYARGDSIQHLENLFIDVGNAQLIAEKTLKRNNVVTWLDILVADLVFKICKMIGKDVLMHAKFYGHPLRKTLFIILVLFLSRQPSYM